MGVVIEAGTTMAQKGMHTSGTVVVDVVEAVATATGSDALSLEPPLNEVVDPEALERVLDGDSVTRVTFEYGGYRVVVDGDGRVTLADPAETDVAAGDR